MTRPRNPFRLGFTMYRLERIATEWFPVQLVRTRNAMSTLTRL